MRAMQKDEREDKLPRWAQETIGSLRRTVADQAASLEGRTSSSINEGATVWTDIYDDNPIPLAYGTAWLVFTADPKDRRGSRQIQVKFLEEGRIELMRLGWGDLVVKPKSSNVIEVIATEERL